MMNDLIRREDALNQITAIDTSIIPYAKAREYVDILKDYVIKIIEDLPSAEPKRTVKVIYKQETYIVTPPKSTTVENKTETNLWIECGNCGARGIHHGWNYCPTCGMRLEWK